MKFKEQLEWQLNHCSFRESVCLAPRAVGSVRACHVRPSTGFDPEMLVVVLNTTRSHTKTLREILLNNKRVTHPVVTGFKQGAGQ